MRSTSTSSSNSHRFTLSAVLVGVLLVLGGCGDADVVDDDAAPPPEKEAAIRLEGPAGGPPAIGEVGELVYLVDIARGTPHTMQRWTGTDWVDYLHVTARETQDLAESAEFEWSRFEWSHPDEWLEVLDVAYGGVGGGQFVRIPAEVEGLIVRICEGEAGRVGDACTAPLDYS